MGSGDGAAGSDGTGLNGDEGAKLGAKRQVTQCGEGLSTSETSGEKTEIMEPQKYLPGYRDLADAVGVGRDAAFAEAHQAQAAHVGGKRDRGHRQQGEVRGDGLVRGRPQHPAGHGQHGRLGLRLPHGRRWPRARGTGSRTWQGARVPASWRRGRRHAGVDGQLRSLWSPVTSSRRQRLRRVRAPRPLQDTSDSSALSSWPAAQARKDLAPPQGAARSGVAWRCRRSIAGAGAARRAGGAPSQAPTPALARPPPPTTSDSSFGR